MEAIDIHAHILPGVDDGARDWDESMAMVQAAYEQGVRCIIATPHHSRRRGIAGLHGLVEELRRRARRQIAELPVFLGEELYYYDGLADDLKSGCALTLAGSCYALVEFDPGVSYESLYQAVRKLCQARYIPVIAHIERYFCLRKKGRLAELVKCGCRLQMNYSSLAGNSLLSSEVRWCRRQVLDGQIHYLGTDMHRMDYRKPELTESLRWLERCVGKDELTALLYGNADKIIQQRKTGD